jgi:hypothetical protein
MAAGYGSKDKTIACCLLCVEISSRFGAKRVQPGEFLIQPVVCLLLLLLLLLLPLLQALTPTRYVQTAR